MFVATLALCSAARSFGETIKQPGSSAEEYLCEACNAWLCEANGCTPAGGPIWQNFCAKGGYDVVANGTCYSKEDASSCCATSQPWPCTLCKDGCQDGCVKVDADIPDGSELCVRGSSNIFPPEIPQLCRSESPSDRCCTEPSRVEWVLTTNGAVEGKPLLDPLNGETVYSASYDGKLTNVRANSGQVMWQVSLSSASLRTGPAWSEAADAIVVGDTSSNMYAVTRSTGSVLWKTSLGSNAHYGIASSPLTTLGGRGSPFVWIGNTDGVMYCLDGKNGTILWKMDTGERYIVSTPVDDGKHIYFGTGGGGRGMLFKLDAMSGAKVATFGPLTDDINSSPVLNEAMTTLYIGTDANAVVALETSTLKQVWSSSTESKVYASPALSPSGTTLYAMTIDNSVFSLDTRLGSVVWKTRLPGGSGHSKGSPLVSADGEIMYIGSDDFSFFAIETKTGKVLWSVGTGGAIDGKATFSKTGSTVFVGSKGDNMYALRT
mmetsp:Transcript_124340/g.175396  ORF Transcript_124340/g.175396 Transcript_124340/m.175396 type:complete len:491 (+) Transcript_124340:1-1473(+)